MQSRGIAVVVTWLGVTAVSIAIAWLAVAHAVAGVAGPAPIVAAPAGSSTRVTLPPEQSTMTDIGEDPAITPSSATQATTPRSTSDPVTVVVPDETPPSTDVSPTTVPPTQEPASSSTTTSFDSAGGVMTMSCDGGDAALISATPDDGYTVAVFHAGPDDIDVEFRSGTQRYTIHGWCTGGRPAAEVGDDD